MIKESREYIKERIRVCNSDYIEVNDPVGDNDISLSQIDRNYKLIFDSLAPELDGNFYRDTVDCTLEIYKRAGSNEVADFDEIYDLAICIKNTIISPLSVKNNENFTDILFSGISPEPLPSNDKVFKILLTFQIIKDFDYQGV